MKTLALYLISELTSKIVPFLTILIIASFLNPIAFGELTLYFIVYEFLIIFIGNNISATTRIDFFSLNKEAFLLSKKTHVIASFITVVLFLIVAKLFTYYYSFNFGYLSILIVASLFRTVSFFVLADLQCRVKSILYAKLNLIYIISLNIAFIFLFYLGFSINSWYFSLLFGSFLQVLYAAYLFKQFYFESVFINFKFDILNIFNEYKKGLIFIPQAIGFWIKLGVDRLLLSRLTNPYLLGQYMFSFQMSFPILILSSAVNLYMTPQINEKLVAKDYSGILKKLYYFFILILVAFIFLIFISKFFISEFYFKKYGASAQYIVPICLAMFFQSSMLIFLNVFYYINKKAFVSFFIFSTSMINLVIGYFSTKYWGVWGLLYTNIIISSVLLLVVILKLKWTFNKLSLL